MQKLMMAAKNGEKKKIFFLLKVADHAAYTGLKIFPKINVFLRFTHLFKKTILGKKCHMTAYILLAETFISHCLGDKYVRVICRNSRWPQIIAGK